MSSANTMARKLNGLSRRYQAVLRKHLKHGLRAGTKPAQRLGRQAMALGLETLDLAGIHEQALITLVLPSYSASIRDAMVRRAGKFFAEAITPIEKTHRTAREADIRLNQMIEISNRRSADLADSNQRLKREITQRKAVEESLRSSERHYSQLLEQSHHLQGQLRLLSRQLLLAQEEERKRISRELHDEIAQTLTGINVRLAALKIEASHNTKGLQNKDLQHATDGREVGGYHPSVRAGFAPDSVGRPGGDSRPPCVYERICETNGHSHSFHDLYFWPD